MTTVPGVSPYSVRVWKTHKKFPRGRVYQNSGSGERTLIKARPPEPGEGNFGLWRISFQHFQFYALVSGGIFYSCLMECIPCQRP